MAIVLLVSAGQAHADDGAGDFAGYEIPSANVTFTNPVTMCGRFEASTSDPLMHHLDMIGTFHAASGTGTATFTRTAPYYANPEGTYSDSDCLSPGSVTGSMTIVFENYDCSGTGTYERRAEDLYSLDFDGTCIDGSTTGISTTVAFDGVQLLCPPEDCAEDPNATAEMSGEYVQTH